MMKEATLGSISIVQSWRFFYAYLGGKLFVVLLLSTLIALLDGIGMAAFLPLLQELGQLGSSLPAVEFWGLRIDYSFAATASSPVPALLLLIFGFFCGKGVARFGLDYFRIRMQQKVVDRVRIQCLQVLSATRYSAYMAADAGVIQNLMGGEVERLHRACSSFFQTWQYGMMAAIYVVLVVALNPLFAAIAILGGLIASVSFLQVNRATKKTSRLLTEGMNRYQGLLMVGITAYKYMKATRQMQKYIDRLRERLLDAERLRRKLSLLHAFVTASREPLVIGVLVGALFVEVVIREIPLPLVFLSVLLLYRALTTATATQVSYNTLLGVSGTVAGISNLINTLAAQPEPTGERLLHGPITQIELQDITFSYGQHLVLDSVNLTIGRRETVGIVGESGAGKTTLVNLLSGLIPPADGTIRVNGENLTTLAKSDYRRRIGYVTQEAPIYSDTIRNNVTHWERTGEIDDAAVWRALQLAQAATFVSELPLQLDARVGMLGATLSGGQRQRLAIARELYRKVDVLILDEATSALDTGNELRIRDNLDRLKGQLTLIVVAHRLSTLRHADRLVYLCGDGTHHTGTFEELYHSIPEFRTLVEQQSAMPA